MSCGDENFCVSNQEFHFSTGNYLADRFSENFDIPIKIKITASSFLAIFELCVCILIGLCDQEEFGRCVKAKAGDW